MCLGGGIGSHGYYEEKSLNMLGQRADQRINKLPDRQDDRKGLKVDIINCSIIENDHKPFVLLKVSRVVPKIPARTVLLNGMAKPSVFRVVFSA